MMEGVVRKKSRMVKIILITIAFTHQTASDTDRFSLQTRTGFRAIVTRVMNKMLKSLNLIPCTKCSEMRQYIDLCIIK